MNKLLGLFIFIGIITFSSCGNEKAAPAAAPLEVSVIQVVQQDVALESEYTGQTYGKSDIQINPRVNGVVLSLNFREGSLIQKGQLLYTIDPLPFQNKVDQAEGRLAEAKTNLARTKSDLDMIEPLAKINAVSQRELVAAKAQYEAAQGQIQSAEGALRNAKIELSYCTVEAPITGLIGISKVRVGDYVNPGPFAILNTISDLSSVRVRFTISEQEYLRIYREATAENSTLKGAGKHVQLVLSDGGLYPYIGEFSFTDRQIDPSTGAMTLEASFENPDKILRPGQYVKVKVVTEARQKALLIPQRSIIEMQGIFQVYLLGDDNKVQLQIIKVGPSFKDAYLVLEGLNSGDKIVMGGTQLLRNGSPVTPKISEWNPGQFSSPQATSK